MKLTTITFEEYAKMVQGWYEDAIKYELMMTPTAKDMEKALQTVERLRKRIKEMKDGGYSKMGTEFLQEILGDKK